MAACGVISPHNFMVHGMIQLLFRILFMLISDNRTILTICFEFLIKPEKPLSDVNIRFENYACATPSSTASYQM